MKWIAKNRKWNLVFLHQSKQFPEIRMQDRISSGNIKVWDTAKSFAEIQAVLKGLLHLLPCHAIQFFTGITGENVAVFAPLVAFIRDMPLKSEILFHLNVFSLSQKLCFSVIYENRFANIYYGMVPSR
jgi:hypothetical protein